MPCQVADRARVMPAEPDSVSAMKIGGVDFPEPLLNALRDGKLVVFAGAGVSMGAPANLPSFHCLAKQVAERTGKFIKSSETDDQFLGRLKEDGVDVRQRAAEILQPGNLEPNALHRNLLRLFQETGPVRIVTTNFDRLFEQAAGDLFKAKPKVFEAPVLPPGNRFEGIVRLHGSVNEPEEMVLTHRDFGRAYLTEEDGWARRFLVSIFTNHTVLFVGYSHSDTIMTYFTPSLSPDDDEKRFALVGNRSNDLDRWRRMGIETIVFPQENKDDFDGLDTGVEGLANFRRRGFIGWQQEIARIAEGKPPMIDNEDSHTIDHALTSVELTRFFVDAAKSPEWIVWLDGRGHLKRLFVEGDLEEQDESLSSWLANQFARNNSNPLFSVILRHNGRLNQHFWKALLWKLGRSEENSLDPQVLSRWINILMNRVPIDVNEYFLLNLMKHCAEAGKFQSLLQVYDVITVRLIQFLPDFEHRRNGSWDDTMKELWEQCLKSNFQHIAHTLLNRVTMRLEQHYSARVAWSSQDNNMINDCISRSAIESHEQNISTHRIDPLIDIARDCLEWLAINDPIIVRNWCNRFINSDSPLLRRLAIHATNTSQDLSADDKMAWLLEHCNVNEHEAKHEIFRMAADVYPQASSQQKEALIQAISQYQAPAEIKDSAVYSIYHRFNWFQWLHRADLNCSLLEAKLARIRSQYPEFRPREHPDFNSWFSGVGFVLGPWSTETLLAKPASKWLPDLLGYQPSREEEILSGQSRDSLLLDVCQAAAQDSSWGLDLADAMAESSEWETDLWTWVIYAWERENTNLDQDSTRRVLSYLSRSELQQQRNARAITGVLKRLIRNLDTADLTEWLDTLHKIAIAIHPHAVAVEDVFTKNSRDKKWNEDAINHPSGKLAEFWLYSISHWYNQQAEPPQALSPEYRRALDIIIEDHGIPGKLGRNILVSWLHSLHCLDSTWTENHLLPLFDTQHEDFSCAWDGLTWGHLSLQVAELLQNKLVDALPQAVQDFHEDNLKRFIQIYVNVMSCLINNSEDKWIYTFFKYTQEKFKLRYIFNMQVGRILHKLDEGSQKEWWNVWLKDYWNNRLQGVPCPLDNAEIATMFEWVIHLQGVFSEAVAMAVQMGPAPLKHSLELYHEVGEMNLINRYPTELAQFLIQLGKCETPPWFWYQDSQILHQLLEKDLPEELANELDDLILRIEISTP